MSIYEINTNQTTVQKAKTDGVKNAGLVKQSEQKPVEKSEKPQIEIKSQDMGELVSHVNQFVQSISTKIGFSYDTFNERSVVLVKDKETGEVIREIPPREMLNLVKQLERVTGIIYHNHI